MAARPATRRARGSPAAMAAVAGRAARLATLAAIVLLSIEGIAAPPAAAHAGLRNADPPDGAVLDRAPAHIRLTFTERPDPELTRVELLDAQGDPVPVGPVQPVSGDERTIVVPLPAELPHGVYTLLWRTVSLVDGHLTSGTLSFGIGVVPPAVPAPAPGAVPTAPPPSTVAVAARLALYVGLILLFAAGVAGLIPLGVRIPLPPGVLAAAWLLAAIATAALTVDGARTVGLPVAAFLASGTGAAHVRLAAAVGATGAATLAVHLRPGRPTALALALVAATAMLLRASAGHAGASTSAWLLQGMHLLAVGVWIGGLGWLALGLREGRADIRRFSRLAPLPLAVVLITGLVRATSELGGPSGWAHPWRSGYGAVLVVKLVLVSGVLALAAVTRYRLLPRAGELGSRALRRAVAGELALAAGVLAATALLVGLPPPASSGRAPTAVVRPLVVRGSDYATSTRLELRIEPGAVGPNRFIARALDYDTGRPIAARRVSLTFSLPGRPELRSTLDLRPAAGGAWEAQSTVLAVDALWEVRALVETDAGSTEVPLQVWPRPAGEVVSVVRGSDGTERFLLRLADGTRVTAHLRPWSGGVDRLSLSFLDPSGGRLPMHHVIVGVVPEEGTPTSVGAVELAPGRYAADLRLGSGTTWIRISGLTLTDRRALLAGFELTEDG